MQFGIYYAFWETEWGGDYLPYIEKVKHLGFDALEVSCAGLCERSDDWMRELGARAKGNGVALSSGYGPRAIDCLVTDDTAAKKAILAFYKTLFGKLALADIRFVGGGLYSYWPVDYSRPVDKKRDWALSVAGIRELAHLAAEFGITLGMEVLNRFEGYLINTAAEGVAFVKEAAQPNLCVMLDTFHMNIEEDSFAEAIRTAGPLLGHLHTGEANRRLPGQGRLPWQEIGEALREIGYNKMVVMEPFILQGGQVGRDIKVFRDMTYGANAEEIDRQTAESLVFLRQAFGGQF